MQLCKYVLPSNMPCALMCLSLQYMTEADFNWRMMKNIFTECHIYDKEANYKVSACLLSSMNDKHKWNLFQPGPLHPWYIQRMTSVLRSDKDTGGTRRLRTHVCMYTSHSLLCFSPCSPLTSRRRSPFSLHSARSFPAPCKHSIPHPPQTNPLGNPLSLSLDLHLALAGRPMGQKPLGSKGVWVAAVLHIACSSDCCIANLQQGLRYVDACLSVCTSGISVLL